MRFIVVLLLFGLISCGGETTTQGDVYFEKGEFQKAIKEYNGYLESNPKEVTVLYNRGRAYEELGEFKKAEVDFLAVLDMDERNLSAFLSLSKLYYAQKAYNKSVIFADKALEQNENSAQGHFLSARAKHQLGYVESALESYSLAININRDFGEAYLYRGLLKIHQQKKSSACEDFRKAVALKVREAKSIQDKYCK